MEGVLALAPAKVNLRLRVLAREATGYHSLETVFCAISLCDELVARPGEDGIRLEVRGAVETGPAEENLAVRAARRFYTELGRVPALDLVLTKRIPSAAGLGGGSSDGVAALRALNTLHGEPVPGAVLLQWAIELGSDLPFFACGSPLALAWSRGERLLALPPLPSRPVLVAHPGEPMPTGAAFQAIARRRGGDYRPRARAVRLEELASWEAIAPLAANDFEAGAVESVPRLRPALATIREAGAEVSLLAGSGASVFGVFPSASLRDAAEPALRALGFATWAAETLVEMPRPSWVSG